METLREAYNYLKSRKWVDLTHNINAGIPRFSAFDPIEEEILFTKEETGFLVKKYTFTGAYSTHIDAPIHFSQKYLRDISNLEMKELVAPIYVLHFEDRVAKNPDYSVSVQDILDFEEEYGKIEEHSFVAFSSNWSKYWDNPDKFYNYDENGQAHTPGWSVAAVKFLAEERNVIAIGHESLDTDAAVEGSEAGFFWAEHAILDHNKYQIEVMTNLDKVPAVGAIIISLVPKIDNGASFPIRSIAILPDAE